MPEPLTSELASSSWPTPRATDGAKGSPHASATEGGPALPTVAAAWPPELLALDDWPTPSATRYGSSQNGINGKGGENERPSAGTPSLDTIAAKLWPTASASDWKGSTKPGDRKGQLSEAAEVFWPTPTVGDSESSGSRNGDGSKAKEGVSLTDMVRTGDSLGRRGRATPPDGASTSLGFRVLNPLFVEALMGWPPGWTACVSPETASSPTKQSSPSFSSPIASE
jgi:hypothetical protein